MIEVNDDLLAMWFMQINPTSDFMGALIRIPTGHKLIYRIRYYRDDLKTSKSKDRKNWYECTSTDEYPAMIEKMNRLVRILSQHAEGELYEVLRNGRTTEEFFADWEKLPFVHHEKVSEEEFNKRTGKTP